MATERLARIPEVTEIVATGGLGPTPDDYTAQGAARAAGVELELSQTALDHLAVGQAVELLSRLLPGKFRTRPLIVQQVWHDRPVEG